ncbi:MAG TPA: FAD binding domain-containing protein [Stellaceae bacterium]|nr:FAD binding domain-containing protein [Stellaceae bacterium]
MKAPAFDYVRPQSLSEAVGLLAGSGGEARLIAGGQSLLAMMNLRLAAPALLIDIARLDELGVAAEDEDWVTLGAGITHAAIEDRAVPDPSLGLMPRVAANLAYRAIRTRGTLGGSLALADPAADWPVVLAALDAQAELCGVDGRRTVECTRFATGVYETRLAEDEIVERLSIPKLSPGARWGYCKLGRKAGEFAEALAVAVADPARRYWRIALGAANGPPLLLESGSRALAGNGLAGDRLAGDALAGDGHDPDALRQAIAADLDSAADRHFDDYQRHLHLVAAMRATRQAWA